MRWNKQLLYRLAYMAQGACSPPSTHTHIHIIESTVRIVRILRTALVGIMQGVTKRCRLSWLTNSALLLYEYMSPNAGGEGGFCGVPANKYSFAHGAQITLEIYIKCKSTFNLWKQRSFIFAQKA
jgi:hypothetical protein